MTGAFEDPQAPGTGSTPHAHMGLVELPGVAELPNCYSLILSEVNTDLSSMTVVDNTPAFPLVSRVHGWRPIASARILRAAELKKQKDCPLCQASDDQHSVIWHAY